MSKVLKYYVLWVLLILVHLLVFFYFPISGNLALQGTPYCGTPELSSQPVNERCNDFSQNASLICFYLLYLLYFYLSALQIKYGLSESTQSHFIMSGFTPLHNGAMKVFMNFPFLFEFKIFTDWTFTKTSLDIFQWFKLAQAHSDLFVAKCNNDAYMRHKLGEKIPLILKFLIGFCGLIGGIILIAGPLLFFSSLNPIAVTNNVTDAKMEFVIAIQQPNSVAISTISLFENNFLKELDEISPGLYEKLEF